jgi:precorrin-2 dehydrogenase/sirohydrochlorin ferrochelatase
VTDYFAAFLDLRGRRCLVVGGGEVGERKAAALLECGACVVVVAPLVTATLQRMARERLIEHRRRGFLASDVRGCVLAISATGVPDVDAAVVAAAQRRNVLVNAVDRPALCDFIFPSVLRRGALQIAVSTGGRSPALAREIRKRLETIVGPEYGSLVERVGSARRRARSRALTPSERRAAGERVVALALARTTTGK